MTPVFDNELTIHNDEYQYIATSYPILKVNELREIPQPDEHGFFSTEDVNLLQSNPQYIQAQQMSEPQLYQDDSINIATYYYDVFIHQHFIYRLKISARNHPFRSYDKALLLYFSKFVIQHYHLMLNSEFSSDTTSLRRVFLNLLQDETTYTEAALELKLKKENWTLHHRYICICLEADTHNWQQHNYSYYSKTLFKMFPAMYSFITQNFRGGLQPPHS